MYISQIEISGFRNIREKKILTFTNDRNLIFGPNGSGKTSILEAIYLLGFGRSFLSVRKEELLNNNSAEFFIASNVFKSESEFILNAEFRKTFSIFLNNEKTDISRSAKNLFPLYFSSSDYVSTISSRSDLRRVFDKFIFGTDTLYSRELIEYKKIIRNKTHILKYNPDRSHLKGWNRLLSEYMYKILIRRLEFLRELNIEIKNKYCKELEIRYTPSSEEFDETGNFSADAIMNALSGIMEREIKNRSTLLGPHLDRYEIFLDERPLRLYSSGEKKLHFLFVFLAYIDIFFRIRNDFPVFLVDDYDIAMDESNTQVLMSKYPAMQIIATSVRNNKKFDTIIKLSS